MSGTDRRISFLPQHRALSPAASGGLDALRAAAAVLVVLHHVRIWLFAPPADLGETGMAGRLFYGVTSLGHQYVIVFFVLSGFLISRAVTGRVAENRFSWRRYMFDRSTRLYIVLIPALALTLGLDLIGQAVADPHSIYGGQPPYPLFPIANDMGYGSAAALLGNGLFLQPFFMPAFGSNAPLWSLGYEGWFYLAFPAGVLALVGPTRQRLVAVALLLLSLLVLRSAIWWFGLWLLGFAAAAAPSPRNLPVRPSVKRSATGGAVASMIAALALATTNLLGARTSDLLVALGTAAAVYCITRFSTGDAEVASWARLARHLATSSYTLYLIHAPILLVVSSVVIVRRDQFLRPSVGGLVTAALITATLVLVADGMSYATERRTKTVRAFISRRSAPVAPAGVR